MPMLIGCFYHHVLIITNQSDFFLHQGISRVSDICEEIFISGISGKALGGPFHIRNILHGYFPFSLLFSIRSITCDSFLKIIKVSNVTLFLDIMPGHGLKQLFGNLSFGVLRIDSPGLVFILTLVSDMDAMFIEHCCYQGVIDPTG